MSIRKAYFSFNLVVSLYRKLVAPSFTDGLMQNSSDKLTNHLFTAKKFGMGRMGRKNFKMLRGSKHIDCTHSLTIQKISSG